MNTEELYTYILTAFEGDSFENIILNKRNDKYATSFEEQYRDKVIEEMNTEKYSEVLNKLARSFLTNLAKGAQSNRFTQEECREILEIYHKLIENISNREMKYQDIATAHFTAVRNYITKYTQANKESERQGSYSPEFILKILGIESIENLKGKKVFDIGCGKKGEFVNYLVSQGIDAKGLDMECEDTDVLEQEDWLCKDYPEKEYDIITSNLTFTKKFNEANQEEANDQECFEYAAAYMKILNSLKVGGAWHYVPAVTFLEELLPEDKFEVINNFVGENIMRTIVKRIKE